MYGIFTYIWVIFGVNVGKYSIHGASGYTIRLDPSRLADLLPKKNRNPRGTLPTSGWPRWPCGNASQGAWTGRRLISDVGNWRGFPVGNQQRFHRIYGDFSWDLDVGINRDDTWNILTTSIPKCTQKRSQLEISAIFHGIFRGNQQGWYTWNISMDDNGRINRVSPAVRKWFSPSRIRTVWFRPHVHHRVLLILGSMDWLKWKNRKRIFHRFFPFEYPMTDPYVWYIFHYIPTFGDLFFFLLMVNGKPYMAHIRIRHG